MNSSALPTEAAILAGGLGTRLRSTVPDLPKPMAPVAGKPFLAYQLAWLERQGVKRVVLSVGYRHESIRAYFGAAFGRMSLQYAVEEKALGTGGGTLLALDQTEGENVFLLNGDTLFFCDLMKLWSIHRRHEADATLALRALTDTGRYGSVVLAETGRIAAFQAHGDSAPGLVNGGVYILNREALRSHAPEGAFSLEKDLLETSADQLRIFGVSFDGFFIDIGTPEDYERAQELLPREIA